MRKTEIGTEVLALLYAGRYAEAVHSFQKTCDEFSHCENISECLQRCLIPKLRYMSLLSEDKKIEKIVTDLLELWPTIS